MTDPDPAPIAPRPTRTLAANLTGLAGWMLAALATGAIGAVASVNAGAFYQSLDRPGWAPPGWLFGPVWTVLYVLMGLAAWLVWQRAGWRGARPALGLFLVQLVFNAMWSWFFFVWQLGGVAFFELLLLLGLIAAKVVAFWRVHRLAAALLLPYLAWVAFASALTWAVWRGNPGVL